MPVSCFENTIWAYLLYEPLSALLDLAQSAFWLRYYVLIYDYNQNSDFV